MSWLPVEVTVAPASEPLSQADALVHCRVDAGDTDEAAYVLALTKAARAHVESYTGLKLVAQTVKCRTRYFCGEMTLPVAPVTSITSVQYLDASGVLQTLSTDVWDASLYGLRPILRLKYGQSWPSVWVSPEAVIVTAQVGFATLPEEIGHAMKLLVGTWYDQRAGTSDKPITETPHAVAALLANFRTFA